jgi:putative aminopeptidase FrvX
MKIHFHARTPLLAAACLCLLVPFSQSAELKLLSRTQREAAAQSAAEAQTLILSTADRQRTIETFLQLVQIKGASTKEHAIREELKRIMTSLGASELPLKETPEIGPLNLIMEIPATSALANKPGILLNAHIDTIDVTDPERISFEPATHDFFHLDEKAPGKPSSFGGDDRSGVAVIVEALRILHDQFWSKGVPHRRIVILFTAEEEIGLKGAKYLARTQPHIFEGLDISLTMDGPIELQSNYPKDSFVFVVSKQNESVQPYSRFISLAADYSKRSHKNFGLTEIGLNAGDFAAFPPAAKAGLHLRSPVRGWHSKERVKVSDLVGHVDLVSYILLAWDHNLPQKITAENLISRAP